jgi:formylglycine-generating enzyme required for sulfatase activity
MWTKIGNVGIGWKIGIAVAFMAAIWVAVSAINERNACTDLVNKAKSAYASGDFVAAEAYYEKLIYWDGMYQKSCQDQPFSPTGFSLDQVRQSELVYYNRAAEFQEAGDYGTAMGWYQDYVDSYPNGDLRNEVERRLGEIYQEMFYDTGEAGQYLMYEMYEIACGDSQTNIPPIDTILDDNQEPKYWFPGAGDFSGEFLATMPAEFRIAVCHELLETTGVVETCTYSPSGRMEIGGLMGSAVRKSAVYEIELKDILSGGTVAKYRPVHSKSPAACPSSMSGTIMFEEIIGEPDFRLADTWLDEKMRFFASGGIPEAIMPEAETADLPEEIIDAEGVPMRLVPAGEFLWWSDYHELPVYLDAYYIDKHEVTNALYAVCVEAGLCPAPHEGSRTRSSYYGNPEYAEFPVVNVNWEDANTYCLWRETQLPTEAQWEKAAHGTDALPYPWGNESTDCREANHASGKFESVTSNVTEYVLEPCVGDTTSVGSYEDGVSPYGVYDMEGNVSEWVADWANYDDSSQEQSPYANPTGPESGVWRVFRGSSWNQGINSAASPDGGDPVFYTSDDLGFRCARVPFP